MTRLTRTSLACVAMLAVASAFYTLGSTSTAQEPKGKFAAPVMTWEYKAIRLQPEPGRQEEELAKELNAAAAEGWEAVGPVSNVRGNNGSVESFTSYVFKRRK